jgi:hypothetical protein
LIATVATYGSPRLNQPTAVRTAPLRAVAPTPPVPLADQRPPQPAPLNASIVALAPAAMTALIQAQEYMNASAPVLEVVHAAQEIDHLIARLDDGDPPPPPTDGASLTVRRLQTARQQLL